MHVCVQDLSEFKLLRVVNIDIFQYRERDEKWRPTRVDMPSQHTPGLAHRCAVDNMSCVRNLNDGKRVLRATLIARVIIERLIRVPEVAPPLEHETN